MRRRNHQQPTPLRNPLELFERNSRAKFLMSAPKPKRREVRSGSKCEELNLSKSGPPCLTERTSMRCAATSLMGQIRTLAVRRWRFRPYAKPYEVACNRRIPLNDPLFSSLSRSPTFGSLRSELFRSAAD